MKLSKNVFITLLLTVVMVFGISILFVSAEEAYYEIGGTKYNINEQNSVGGWHFVPKSKTLELYGYMESSDNIEFAGFDLQISLKNDNSVYGIDNRDMNHTLTITGSGKLNTGNLYADTIQIQSGTIEMNDGSGVTGNDVYVKGGTLDIKNSYCGLGYYYDSSGNAEKVSVSGGNITINNCYYGIAAAKVNISGGKINIKSSEDTGIYAVDESISISGGNHYVESSRNIGIYAPRGSITISGKNTRVDATGGTFTPDVVVSKNLSTETRTSPAILAQDKLTVSSPLGIITPKGGKVKTLGSTDSQFQTVCNPDGSVASHAVIEAAQYKITVKKPKNGTAKADKQTAKAGEKVKVTAKPASGYAVDKMTYTNASGKETKIASSGQFTMPASDVSIKVTFKKKAAPKPSGVLITTMTSSGDSDLSIKWTKMKNVDGYELFFSRCNTKTKKYTPKSIRTFNNNTLQCKMSGLKKNTAYKAYLKAYVKKKNGKKKYVKKYVRSSPVCHTYTSGGTKKYTNASSITVNKAPVSLNKGKTFKLVITVNKLDNKRLLMPTGHTLRTRCQSSNTKIATITNGGTIKGVNRGTCYVYAYAHNGVLKKVKVTVK